MGELPEIQTLIARVRRRLRLQRALEGAATAALLAIAAALVVFWCWRMERIAASTAELLLAGIGGLLVLTSLAAALRPLPALQVAARIDRASGLANRLATACDFAARLNSEHHPATRALMQAAIADGIRAVPRANLRAAAPYRLPEDSRPLALFALLGAAITLLTFGPPPPPRSAAIPAIAPTAPATAEEDLLDPDDLQFQQQFVDEMKQLAAETKDQALTRMASDLQALLDKAQAGKIGKRDLLARMEAVEKQYTADTDDHLDQTLADLKDQGKELAKSPVTKRLGEALAKGDMEAAKKELERLGDEVEQGKLKPEEKKQLAEALDQAAAKQEQKQQQQEQKQEQQRAALKKQLDSEREDIRRLEKKLQERPNDEETQRTLEKKKRVAEKLDRDLREKEKADRPKRQAQRLSRDLKEAADNLRQKEPDQQKQAAQKLRDGGGESQKVGDNQKKQANQQKVRSRMEDLKDALRRAKPRPNNGGGQRQQNARNQRLQDWERRASGQKGNAQAWRAQGSPGQGQSQGEKGQGQKGQGQEGDQPGSKWGDEHDPNLTGDATRMNDARFRADELKGAHGAGPSRRETILASAQKGFAHAGYRNVYADYKKVVEEIIRQEKVPQGMKSYVQRYFYRIKPKEDR